ncbi:Tetratricopeptide repeat-containing protein [Muriicola jejuensis]|uniref:Tetratricopeptide repeat protein n=1 Tax=Muriicola jejuensis TaxID=504488 RepID=A0A6P0U8Q3_9FLAO|nr:histidine kinase [Muriicola jejuensis]NER09474.1 tetratricopeptide repeat protein [Muriicola jejuensis]SMP08334.1 Tetratricopeptide repeat-containing protein [Muriicola jejuensis]
MIRLTNTGFLIAVFLLSVSPVFAQVQSSTKKTDNREEGLTLYRAYLDSAKTYKTKDFQKSIDYIARSISELDSRDNRRELASSLALLAEVYGYYGQSDLAIANYRDALQARYSPATTLALGKAYVRNRQWEEALAVLEPLEDDSSLAPYSRVEVYEAMGEAHAGLGGVDKALAFFRQGLTIATKNQIGPKIPDLNSKIADTYASVNRLKEANAYYNNSLMEAEKQAPQRAVREKEKVADFLNKSNRFDDEIKLRKSSLKALDALPAPTRQETGIVSGQDSVSRQRINYKIANAYIAQDQYDEAIPFLERSIAEAGMEEDLVVQKDATRELSEVYRRQGDFTKALETYQKYVAVVDTLYARKEQEISRAARLNREIASIQNRISGLEQERELSQSKYDLALAEQRLTEESNKRQLWIIYSLLFGMLFMSLAAFFFYRSTQKQKLANHLLALKSLRSQMNPHFIFNALNSVNNYISNHDERSANRYLSDFSKLMRTVLEHSEEDFIGLSKEVELLELYLKLEHSRFPDKFDYRVEVDPSVDKEAFKIPPMLLQPYLENAIWHGLRYRETKGELSLRISQKEENVLEICIEDNGIGRKRSAELKTPHQRKQRSTAMRNIQERIAILNDMYKTHIKVRVQDLDEKGTGTRVLLTLIKGE